MPSVETGMGVGLSKCTCTNKAGGGGAAKQLTAEDAGDCWLVKKHSELLAKEKLARMTPQIYEDSPDSDESPTPTDPRSAPKVYTGSRANSPPPKLSPPKIDGSRMAPRPRVSMTLFRNDSVRQRWQMGSREPSTKDCLPVNDEEKELVMETWEYVHDAVERDSAVNFLGLFDMVDTLTKLECRSCSDEQLPQLAIRLSDHAQRLLSVLEKTVARMDEDGAEVKFTITVSEQEAETLVPYFLRCIKKAVDSYEGDWTDTHETAWRKLIESHLNLKILN